jgi:hypothetical protein
VRLQGSISAVVVRWRGLGILSLVQLDHTITG